MKTVLIVDSDLGFVFWLGQGLDEAGYSAFPARSIRDARTLLNELKIEVDLLIVNPALTDVPSFIEAVRRRQESTKLVLITDAGPELPPEIPNVDLRYRKPGRADELARFELMAQIEQVLPPFDPEPAANA